jgi:hypothetical protein
MSAIYQPWEKTYFRREEEETIINDGEDGQVIVRIPGRHRLEQAEKIYNVMRMEYLRGYMEGATDKINEIKEVLNYRY